MSQTAGLGNVEPGPTVPTQFTTDSGIAIPAANNLNILGGSSISTSGAGSTITIDFTGVPGGVTSVSGTTNRITASPTTGAVIVDISASYVGQSSITTLGTISTGVWNASLIPLAYGGTNANLTASNGGIFYSTATAGAILAGTATAGQVLLSGSNAAPSWGTLSSIAVTSITGTANQIVASASTGAVTLSFPATGGISIGSYQATSPPTGGIIAPGSAYFGTTSSTGVFDITVPDAVINSNNSFIIHNGSTELRAGVSTLNNYAWISTGTSGMAVRPLLLQGNSGVGINLTSATVSALDVSGNVSIGTYAGANPAPANGLIVSGSTSIGSASATSLFNVGSSNQFQINSSGVVTSGTWNGSVVALAYGGTNANLTASNGGIFYSTATAGAILSGTATAGQILRSGSSAAPSWSTATYPATATGTGTILRADGTNWVATTATYPATTTINQVLYSSSANVVGGITASANGVLISSSANVPSWLAAGTTGQVLIATTSNPPSWGTLSSISVTSITGTANQITASASTGAVTLSFPATGGISIGSYQATSPPTGGIIAPGSAYFGTTSSTGVFDVTVPDAVINTNTAFILHNGSTQLRAGVSTANNYAWISAVTAGVSTRPLLLQGSTGVGVNLTSATVSALDVNGNVSIGTYAGVNAAPTNGAIISGVVGIGTSSVSSGYTLDVQIGSGPCFISNTTYGSGAQPTFIGRRAGGTQGSPTATAAGISIGRFSGGGHTGSAFITTAIGYLEFNSAEAFSATNQGTYFTLFTTPKTTTTAVQRLRIEDNGNTFIGNGTALSTLDVGGGVAVGTYAGVNTAPSNGMIVSGTLGVGTSSPSASAKLNVSSTSAYNSVFNGTNAAVDGSSAMYGILVSNTFTPPSNATSAYGINVTTTFSSSGNTFSSAAAISVAPVFNASTAFTAAYGIYIPSMTGNASTSIMYGLFVKNPTTAAKNISLFTDNFVCGSTYASTVPPAGGALIQGKVSIGAATNTYSLEVTGGDIAVQTIGNTYRVKTGSNARAGTAVLVAGTVTVSTTAVGANSMIFLGQNVPGGTPGALYVSVKTNGTSFVVTSTNVLDTSTIAWMIFEPS